MKKPIATKAKKQSKKPVAKKPTSPHISTKQTAEIVAEKMLESELDGTQTRDEIVPVESSKVDEAVSNEAVDIPVTKLVIPEAEKQSESAEDDIRLDISDISISDREVSEPLLKVDVPVVKKKMTMSDLLKRIGR